MTRKVTSLVVEESWGLCLCCGEILLEKTIREITDLGVDSITCPHCDTDINIKLFPEFKRKNGKRMYQLSWEYISE